MIHAPYKTPEELAQLVEAVVSNQLFTGLHVLALAPNAFATALWLNYYFPSLQDLQGKDRTDWASGKFVPYGYMHEAIAGAFPFMYWLRLSDARYIMDEAAKIISSR